MSIKAKRYTVTHPIDAAQAANIDAMFQDLYKRLQISLIGTTPAAGTNGSFLQTATGVAGWSTLILPITAATGSLLYGSATNTISALADVATGNALISGGLLTAPSWGKIGLTTHVSGTLPLGSGGTGATAFTAGSIIFSDGTNLAQKNAKFLWDDTNNRIGLGVTSPAFAIDLRHTGTRSQIHFSTGSDDGGYLTSLDADTTVFTSGAAWSAAWFANVAACAGLFLDAGSVKFTANSGLANPGVSFTPTVRGQIWPSGGASFLGTISDPGSGIFLIDGSIKITGGTPALGQVLTSDANGLATWEPAAGGGEPTEETTTSTGTVNNYDLDAAYTVLRCNNATDLTLTGFTCLAAAPTAGDRVRIISVGAGNVLLAHQDAGSTAANRLINSLTSASMPLAAGFGSAEYQYDATTLRWRLVNFDQGAPITPTFDAATFAAAVGTWTLTSGDVNTLKYVIRQSGSMLLTWDLRTTTTSNITANLEMKLPGGFSTAGTQTFTNWYETSVVAGAATREQVSVGGAFAYSVYFNILAGTSFPAETNTIGVRGSCEILIV